MRPSVCCIGGGSVSGNDRDFSPGGDGGGEKWLIFLFFNFLAINIFL